jgi:hypothetical protein
MDVALSECFKEYNNYGVASISDKFALPESDQFAIKALIFGVDVMVLDCMGKHLHKYKERDAAFTSHLLKSSRWHLGYTCKQMSPASRLPGIPNLCFPTSYP